MTFLGEKYHLFTSNHFTKECECDCGLTPDDAALISHIQV